LRNVYKKNLGFRSAINVLSLSNPNMIKITKSRQLLRTLDNVLLTLLHYAHDSKHECVASVTKKKITKKGRKKYVSTNIRTDTTTDTHKYAKLEET